MKKIVLKFHEYQFNAKRGELTNRVNQKNEALDVVKRITNNEITELNFDKVCSYLNKKSGFVNSHMSANAYGVLEEYNLIKFVSESQHKDEEIITFKKGKYSFDQDQLKELYTDYLKEEYIEHYRTLVKVCEALNDVPTPLRRLIYLNAEKTSIDKEQFNTLMQMIDIR